MYFNVFINFAFTIFLFLCIGKRDLQSIEVEIHMNNRMDIDEEDERNIDDNEIPEKQMKLEINLTEDKQTTKLQDSTGDHKLDETRKKSIISMFIYIIII